MEKQSDEEIVSKKKIALKNGKHVLLEFYRLPDSYSIYAVDEKGYVVGQLSFEISYKFATKLDEETRQELAEARNIPLSMINEEIEVVVMQSEKDNFEIRGDYLRYKGRIFALKNKVAYLDLIEIKDKKFFQVGLGSAMHKEMENFAKKTNCDEIRLAIYFPFGEFGHATPAFYKKSGYTFEQINGIMSVYKVLEKENAASNQNMSSNQNTKSDQKAASDQKECAGKSTNLAQYQTCGTPINARFLREK